MTQQSRVSGGPDNGKAPIVCFSHLAWDASLFQRPQQLMSRLASLGHPVYYFACVGHRRHREKPMKGPVAGAPGVQVYTIPYAPGVTKFAGARRWAAGLQIASILVRKGVRRPVLWFYHPSLFAMGYSHDDAAIVYDVMDHFPSFEATVDDVYFDELTLLAEADVVFAGGRSLDRHVRDMMDVLTDHGGHAKGGSGARREARSPSTQIHCLPSGVDLQHFSKAMDPAQADESPLWDLPTPRFGYFGAIDERMDWDIITRLASETDGSVILAGPVLCDPPGSLPDNIHLMGAIDYEKLPLLLAGFNVCLIPFRNTSLVEFVSPTKTPEYLAGGRPVVSTPIPDVVADYGDLVRIASSPEDFAAACIETAAQPVAPETLTNESARRAKTWDQIAAQMDEIVTGIINYKGGI